MGFEVVVFGLMDFGILIFGVVGFVDVGAFGAVDTFGIAEVFGVDIFDIIVLFGGIPKFSTFVVFCVVVSFAFAFIRFVFCSEEMLALFEVEEDLTKLCVDWSVVLDLSSCGLLLVFDFIFLNEGSEKMASFDMLSLLFSGCPASVYLRF